MKPPKGHHRLPPPQPPKVTGIPILEAPTSWQAMIQARRLAFRMFGPTVEVTKTWTSPSNRRPFAIYFETPPGQVRDLLGSGINWANAFTEAMVEWQRRADDEAFTQREETE